jgi:hypothetical protein
MAITFSDSVRDFKLDTELQDGQIIHTRYVTNPALGQWNSRVDERWHRTRELGRGAFGVVWLEACQAGPSSGQVRAVKGMKKAESPLWPRELEAVIKFSHTRV